MPASVDFHKYVYYDETSPTCLRRKTDGYRSIFKAGDVAGGLQNGNSYTAVSIANKNYLAHRVIWEMFNGPIPKGMLIDHIDRDRLNCRITNLRLASSAQNMGNAKRRVGKSGFTGAYRFKDKFVSKLNHNGVTHNLGVFDTAEEASAAYQAKASELRGEFHYSSPVSSTVANGYPSTYPTVGVQGLLNWDTCGCGTW